MSDQEAGRAGDGHQRTCARESGDTRPVPADGPGELERLSGRLAELEAQVRELDDKWRRALAELDNTRKRQARDLRLAEAAERVRVVRHLLPVIDNLDLALEHARADPGALAEGVRVVRDQAIAALDLLGFPRDEEVGVLFDPGRHEAMGTVATSDAPRGTVVRVVRPGYGEGDSQLRPTGVIVATEQKEG